MVEYLVLKPMTQWSHGGLQERLNWYAREGWKIVVVYVDRIIMEREKKE